MDRCPRLGIQESDLRRTVEQLTVEFARPAGWADALWRLMHKLLETASNNHERKMINFQMARFMWEEKRDCLHVSREAARIELYGYKEAAEAGWLDRSNLQLKISTAGAASCPACQALDGSLFTYDEALRVMPLPVPDCTNEKDAGHPRGWCRCTWGRVPRW
jgi:hypothetical protein